MVLCDTTEKEDSFSIRSEQNKKKGLKTSENSQKNPHIFLKFLDFRSRGSAPSYIAPLLLQLGYFQQVSSQVVIFHVIYSFQSKSQASTGYPALQKGQILTKPLLGSETT